MHVVHHRRGVSSNVDCSNIRPPLRGHTIPPLVQQGNRCVAGAFGKLISPVNFHPNRHRVREEVPLAPAPPAPQIGDDEGVQLPDAVRRRIQERAEAVDFRALASAAASISDAYRAGRQVRIGGREGITAYLVARMPATYAATHAVLGEVRRRLGEREVGSVLDIGAGAGAASLAARQWFPAARLTLVERDAAMAAAARDWLPDAAFVNADISRAAPLGQHDLVVAAYSLGEIGSASGSRLWAAARVALVVVEPGTPHSFAVIRSLRAGLLAGGANMLAPCPAAFECPMPGTDWCHFAARVERSSLHRKLKSGTLGYEDEKYSYVALSREPVVLPEARIIRHPQHSPGLVVLETCTAQGLHRREVRKRERAEYRVARHSSWGDAYAGI